MMKIDPLAARLSPPIIGIAANLHKKLDTDRWMLRHWAARNIMVKNADICVSPQISSSVAGTEI
jgi:hypothetical protein